MLERVYHNHSHWLTAHLPKLIVLRDEGLLDDLILPEQLTPVMKASLRWIGVEPDDVARFDPSAVLSVAELTIVGNDRFRPELLRSVRDQVEPAHHSAGRRLYVSRVRATRRRLVNEAEVEAVLGAAGFESVVLEDLDFEQQVSLMGEAEIVCGPHGAGLTNMIFCRPGTHVVEFADLGFPNPNFYAMSAALGHRHWLLSAEGLGRRAPARA